MENLNYDQKFIAHCMEIQKENFEDLITIPGHSKIILIGQKVILPKKKLASQLKIAAFLFH